MRKHMILMILVTCAGLLVSCGDKLDPGAPDDTGSGSGVANSPSTNGNTTMGDSNTVATDTNTTAGNTNTNAGNTNAPTPSNTNTTTPSSGKTLCGTQATTISYATHIQPLVSSYCSSCHGSGGTSPLMTSYNSSKSAFTDRGAKDEIDSGSMPRGRTLSNNEICLFDTWATTNYAP